MTKEADASPDERIAGMRAWRASCAKGKAKELMKSILADAERSDAEVVVLRDDMVFGADHLKSALHHALKAIDEGRNSSESLAMETLLYASGERQLGAAIDKMSVDEGTELIVIARLRGEGFKPATGWEELEPRAAEVSWERLKRYGIGDRDGSTIAQDDLAELVLERVASVDILKK